MADEAQSEQDWVADGTETVEPVTVETPVVEDGTVVIEVAEGDESNTVIADEVVEEVVEQVQAMMEGRVGDDAFEIPEDFRVPITRGDTVEYMSIKQLRDEGMKGNDYRLKTTELADMRREVDRKGDDFARREARMDAKAAHVAQKEEEIKAALTDPKSAAAYEEHLTQYRDNPMYRKHVDNSLSSQETEAELSALQAREDQRVVQEASGLALGWIEELASEYATVDPERVRGLYSQALSSGTAALDRSEVQRIYQQESDHVQRTVSPLQDQLAEITAQLKSLQDGAAATEHNEETQHAVKRAKTVPVATGSGAPARVQKAPEKFAPAELADRNAEWSRSG